MMRSSLAFIVFFAALYGCDDCAKVRSSTVAPGGRYTVTVYESDCGATTSVYSVVNLRESNADFHPNSDDDVTRVLGPVGNLRVRWTGPTRLEVIDSHFAEPPKPPPDERRLTSWHGVSIRYVEK
jgi:hypothetical protein